MSEISREHEHLAQNTLADKIRQETDAAKVHLLKEALIGSDATTVLPPKYKWWKSNYPVYLRKDPGSKNDVNGIKEGAKLIIMDVAKETADTKRGKGTNENHIWYQVRVENQTDLYTKAYGNTDIGWVSAEFIHADTSHIDNSPAPIPPGPAPIHPGPAPIPPGPAPIPPGPAPIPPGPAPIPPGPAKLKYYSEHDNDDVNANIDQDPIDKWTLEFSNGEALINETGKILTEIDPNNTLKPLFEEFGKKSSTYPLLWAILKAESGIHGEDNNGWTTNVGRWLQRDPVYRSGVESRIQWLETDYQALSQKLTQAIANKNLSEIQQALKAINDHLSCHKNQELMDNLAWGLSDAQWWEELGQWNWTGNEPLSAWEMEKWHQKFDNGDLASVYEFSSDVLEARDVLAGQLMWTVEDPWNQWSSFETIIDGWVWAINDKNIASILGSQFGFMWKKFQMPTSLGKWLLGTGAFKDSYSDSLQRHMKNADKQWLSRDDKIQYVRQMFMSEVIMQKEDEIIAEFKKDTSPSGIQNLRMAEQFFKNKAFWTEVWDNWQMYMLKGAATYAAIATTGGFAGWLAEWLAARGATTTLGRLWTSLQSGPIASRIYQFGALHTGIAAWTGLAQMDSSGFTDSFSTENILHSALFFGVFSWLKWALNKLPVAKWPNGLPVSRTFMFTSDILAGMGVMWVNEIAFDGQFTAEEIVNTIIFAAAANITHAQITKKPDGKIKIVPKTKPETTTETPKVIKGRETLLHENFPNTAIKLADGTNITAGKFNNTETVFTVEKPGKQPKTVKVWELANELTTPQRRELYSNTLVKKIREFNNQRNELITKRNKLSDKQDKDQNNYGLQEQIKETQAQIVKLETTMKDLYKRANDSRLIDEALSGVKKWPEEVSPNTPVTNNAQSEVLNTKLASLEKQYKVLKESGREWQRDRQELIRLNDEINGLKKQIAEQNPAIKQETVTRKEKFTAAEKGSDHGKMRELEWQIGGINKQIAAAERLTNKNTKTRELIRLNEQKTDLVNELNTIRNKYQVSTYEKSAELATNTTLNEFSAGVEKLIVPKTETISV